jgi:hypothetical protein
VSFDLYVWHEPQPIGADEVNAKLRRWSDGDASVFAAHTSMSVFRDALLRRFPALESLDDDELDTRGVWSVTPEPSDSILAISCVWSRAGEVHSAVQGLAREHGLVCYDPQRDVLVTNAPGYVAEFVLTTERLGDYPDPDERRIEWAIAKLSDDNFFATLARADGWFVQVGYGKTAGVRPGSYAMEYQEGSTDNQFASQTTDMGAATRFMLEFRAGVDTWKRRHSWHRLEL